MTLELFGTVLRFADPIVLVLLVAIPALAAIAVARERRSGGAILFSSIALIPGRRRAWRTRLRPLLVAVRLVALVLLVTALARPQIVKAAEISTEGIDIAVVIDISGSMSSTDFGGISRISGVKSVVRDFVGGLKNDRVGLVVFGSEALTLAPLTFDHEAVQRLVDPLESDGRLVGGSTAIGTGLATAINVLRESAARSKVAILLTDGENNSGQITPADATRAAKLLGVRVYTIGAVPTQQRQRGAVEVDEALMRDMAETTGGRYFSASDATALAQIYREIAQLERTRLGIRTEYVSYDDVMVPFLIAGTLLVLLEYLFGLTLLRRTP